MFSWLAKLEDELVLRLRRLRRLAIARIVRVAQEAAFGDELEAGRLDLLAQERLLDAMQRLGFGDAGARAAGVIRDDVETARLERHENRAVHLIAVDADEAEVVIVEHQRNQIESIRRELGRRRILEWAHYRNHVGYLLRPVRHALPRIGRTRLSVDPAGRADRARDELGGIAAGSADIERRPAFAHADERQHLGRLAPDVIRAVSVAAIRAGDDRRC